MAIRGQEVELLGDGIRADSPTKGAFALNMLYRRNSWEVRRGFGQVVELDTTMGAIYSNQEARRWGYLKHLGSYLMTTSFGHEQIISVFLSSVLSGDRQPDTTTPINNSTLSQTSSIYIVDIYDITTGDRWEEPVFRHTASFGDAATSRLPMPDWHGHYETYWRQKEVISASAIFPTSPDSTLEDRQEWLIAGEPAEPFFFTEMNDVLYLGNKDTGVLAYIPAVFRGRRRGAGGLSTLGRDKQVYTVYDRSWAKPYSESSVLINAVAVDGPFSEGITYLSRSEFPSPKGGANIGGRLVLFEGTNVYFSDVGYPTSIAADNVMSVPSEGNITAAREYNGNLIIFTAAETWYYQPSAGFAATAGRLVRISEGAGCLGNEAITVADGALVWMGPKGVYALSNNLQVETISEPIEPFFTDFITNPVTNYFVAAGELSNPLPDQAASVFSLVGQVTAAYSQKLDSVMFCIPERNAILYFGAGKWSLWSTETMVTTSNPAAVGVTRNIESPWLMTSEEGIYLVGSLPQDGTGETLTAVSSSDNTRSRPYYILKYGRGGAVDRSVEAVEDYRKVIGRWRSVDEKSTAITPAASDHYLYVGKPIPIPEGTVLGPIGGTTSDAANAVDGSMWVPFSIVPGYMSTAGTYTFGAVQAMSISFTFDNTNWQPVLLPAPSANVQFFLPPERQPTLAGWTVQFAAPNTINITFTGAGGAWLFQPNLALQKRQLNRLLYIPFRPTTNATTIGPNITLTAKTIQDATAANHTMRAFLWDQTRILADRHEDNDVAQSVDWAYKSSPVSVEGRVQVKGRGLYMDVLSHGPAAPTHRLAENWPFGLLNVVSAPDTKGWSSQIIDMVNTKYPASVKSNANVGTLRTRYAQSSAVPLTSLTFNSADANPPFWGDIVNPQAKNPVIVGDEEVGQLAVSDSVRGESFTYMLWGSLQNKAERIILESARAVLRVLGGKHRRGR